MVDPPSAELRRLPLRLAVAGHLEQIDLGMAPDPDEGQRAFAAHVLAPVDLGLEHLPIEVHETFGVAGQDGDVVHAFQEHLVLLQSSTGASVSPFSSSAKTSSIGRLATLERLPARVEPATARAPMTFWRSSSAASSLSRLSMAIWSLACMALMRCTTWRRRSTRRARSASSILRRLRGLRRTAQLQGDGDERHGDDDQDDRHQVAVDVLHARPECVTGE